MAYSNSSCSPCRTPIPSVWVDAPPVCEGTDCEEIYPAQCTIYTGPNITCLGITNGMSLNQIIQILAEELCAEGCCINPVEWLLQYALNTYNIQLAKGESPDILLILEELLKRGIVTNSCNICCPDRSLYLFGNKDDVGAVLLAIAGQVTVQQTNPNNAPGFSDCLTLLGDQNPLIIDRFDGTLDQETNGTEAGSISSYTTLCIINNLFGTNQFDSATLYNIINLLLTQGLAVQCKQGNLIISNFAFLLT
jgi:hypothetical protein